jgi:pimeloyl-ACP methyl ester carboxylesterase
MNSERAIGAHSEPTSKTIGARARLLAGAPVTERRLEVAGVSTPILEGGDGPPVVVLHGQGGFAAQRMPLVAELVTTNHVVAPDLPGLGASHLKNRKPDTTTVMTWLAELIDETCAGPPALVGMSLGGAIAARFAVDHGDRIARLVLINSGGLGGRPSPRALIALIRYAAHPTERSLARFRAHVMVDPERARRNAGDRWEPLHTYMLELARTPSVRAANKRLLRELGIPAIPAEDLARITVPTFLVWARHDRVMALTHAERASTRHGWPLTVIEDAGHVVFADQPTATVEAVRSALITGETQ